MLALTCSYQQVALFGTVFLVIRYYFMYCLFIYLHCLFPVAIVRCRQLWESPRVWRAGVCAASGRARQVTLDHIEPMCSLSLSSIHTGMQALILLPKPHTLGIWVHTWLVCLVMQSRVSCRSFIFMMLSMSCVLVWEMWSSIRRDVNWPCEERCCGLSNGWNGGDG
jgi:hypothetical protein